MRPITTCSLVVLAAFAAVIGMTSVARSQEKPGEDPGAMMKRWAELTKPGKMHERLAPLVGTFDTVTSMRMTPGAEPVTSKGEATGTWTFGKRFIELRSKGPLMGMPMETLTILGYDNFRKRFTATALNSLETAQRAFEGSFDQPTGGALHLYGKVDEFLDGTVGKMARSTWRFPDADTIVHEVHDLDLGVTDTLVFDVTYKRRK